MFLVGTFFKHTKQHCFIVRENWVLEELSTLYSDPRRLLEKTQAAVIIAILLAVFAIGTQYAHLEARRNAAAGAFTSPPAFSEEEVGVTFYQPAIRLLPEIIELSCLESVQACLLFGFYALPVDAAGLGYIYVNLAVRLAMQNGMHRRCTTDAFTPMMVEGRNRVWWMAYSLERYALPLVGSPTC